MKIILYQNRAKKNYLNKEDYLEEVIVLEGTLQGSTSVIHPSINIRYQGFLNANYIYIPNFKRYYFIDEITSLANNLWNISCNIDVLYSFKDKIHQLNCLIERNETKYNLMLNDSQLVSTRLKIEEYVPTKGSKVNLTFGEFKTIKGLLSDSKLNISICTLNNEGALPTTEVEESVNNILPDIDSYSSNLIATSQFSAIPINTLMELSRRVVDDSSLNSFIFNMIVFPFNLIDDVTNKGENIILGKTQITSEAFKLKRLSPYYCVADFKINNSNDTSFRDFAFTKYEIYIPYVGWKEFDANLIFNKRLCVYFNLDYLTGESQVILCNETDDLLLYIGTAQVGINISLSTTNNREILNSKISSTINATLGSISAVLSANPLKAGDKLLGVGAKLFTDRINLIDKGQTNISGGNLGLYTPQEIRVRITSSVFSQEVNDSNYLHQFGLPLNEYHQIKEIKGFTKIQAPIDFTNLNECLEEEKKMIENELTNGFYNY